MMIRRAVVAGATAAAAVAGAVGISYACSVQPSVLSVGPPAGPAGSVVTVRGQAVAAQGPIEIRWNALNGQQLALADADAGGNFAANVSVPAARPGVYSIMVVAGKAGVTRSVFEVTPSAGAVAMPATGNASLWAPATHSAGSLSSGGSGLGVALGSAFLAVGLVGGFAGVTVATVRRRRVSVRS